MPSDSSTAAQERRERHREIAARYLFDLNVRNERGRAVTWESVSEGDREGWRAEADRLLEGLDDA